MNNPDNPVIKSGGTITFTPSKKLTSNLEVNFISKNPGGKKKKHQKIWRIFVDITSQPLALSCHPMRRPK